MLRVWGKLWNKQKIVQSYTAEDSASGDSLEVRVKRCLGEIVRQFDLPVPLWLTSNISDLTRVGSTKFNQDHFIESFPYQSLEIEIIEMDEDDKKAL